MSLGFLFVVRIGVRVSRAAEVGLEVLSGLGGGDGSHA